MSENSDGGGGSQISALDDLLAGGVAGSASVIVGRELDLFIIYTASVNYYRSNILLNLSVLCSFLI
jgi:hypothetical protein